MIIIIVIVLAVYLADYGFVRCENNKKEELDSYDIKKVAAQQREQREARMQFKTKLRSSICM